VTPDVYFEAVTLLAEDLRGDVVGGAAESALPLAIEVNLGGETEIAQLDLQTKACVEA
jgi:hypothetical protein